jgi:uncharacterized protein YjbJ (UPF0337 family)
MNTDVFKGKWNEFKGEVRKTWANLTGDELEKTKGDLVAIKGLIQQKYGDSQESISQRLGAIADRYAEKAKEALRGEKSPTDSHTH